MNSENLHRVLRTGLLFMLTGIGLCGCRRPPADASSTENDRNVLTVQGEQLLLNGEPFLVRGLRCSNALMSDSATSDLIEHLDTLRAYGVNSFSVYFMGSRFGDVRGFKPDASLDPDYGARMERILEAADRRSMVVLVGVLYWGNSRAKYPSWTQAEAERAVAETIRWLSDRPYRNVFVDIDNEGMAEAEQGFDPGGLLQAGKAVNATIPIAFNSRHSPPPGEADLLIHHARPVEGKPYVETEGTVGAGTNGGYWGAYSKRPGYYNYINIGLYNEAYIKAQIAETTASLEQGRGYMLASTWLQAAPPFGPNHRPGGYGTPDDPGIRWWLEFLRDWTLQHPSKY